MVSVAIREPERSPHSRLPPVTASWLLLAATAPGTAFLDLLLAHQARPLYSLALVYPDTASIVMHRRRQKDHCRPHYSSEPPRSLLVADLGDSWLESVRREAVLIIQTIEVFVLPFNEVSEQFAFDEGEGDRSLAYWRKAHENYFRRNDLKDHVFDERCWLFANGSGSFTQSVDDPTRLNSKASENAALVISTQTRLR